MTASKDGLRGPVFPDWQPIETAPRTITSRFGNSEYSCCFLAYPVHGDVARVRWWQSASEEHREKGYQNFLADGGTACHPTHWMPLPEPPQ
jgi:hypothetical protein